MKIEAGDILDFGLHLYDIQVSNQSKLYSLIMHYLIDSNRELLMKEMVSSMYHCNFSKQKPSNPIVYPSSNPTQQPSPSFPIEPIILSTNIATTVSPTNYPTNVPSNNPSIGCFIS